MTKRILVTVGVVGALLAGGAAFAGGHGGGMFGRIVQQLELTPEQQELAKELKSEVKADREALREQTESLREQLKAEILADKPSKQKVHALIDQLEELQTAQRHEDVDRMLALVATFTPEQKAEAAALMDEMKERMEERRRDFEGGAGGPPGGRGYGPGEGGQHRGGRF